MDNHSPNTSADYFADSSAETVTHNETANESSTRIDGTDSYPPAPIIDANLEQSLASNEASFLATQFMAQTDLPTRICCPFCMFDFGYEVLLKDHIKQSHGREMKHVLESAPGEIDFHQCPFCNMKFYYRELLPKHIIRKHEMCVVNMFSGFSPEKYVYCRFCPHKILRKHYKLLMIHIEKKHYELFERYIITKYSNITKSCEDLLEIDSKKVEQKVVHYDSPIIATKLSKLTTEDNTVVQSPPFKSILKPKTAYPLDNSECLNKKKENLMYANLTLPEKTRRRKLRFNLPSENDEKKEGETPSKKQKVEKDKSPKWKFPKKSNSPKKASPKKSSPKQTKKEENKENVSVEMDVDGDTTSQICRFKCGLCSEAYDVNSKLVEHLKKKHRGLKLQPQYRCGECNAKFYRNNYLVKHCFHSHGPLCLKTPNFKNKKDSSYKF